LFPVVRNSSKSLRSRGLKYNEYYSLVLRLCVGRYSQEYLYRNKDEIELQHSTDSLGHSERTWAAEKMLCTGSQTDRHLFLMELDILCTHCKWWGIACVSIRLSLKFG